MESRDVAQLITAIAAPLMAGFLVHSLGRRLTFQRAAMDTFHRLVQNMNDFRLALIANQWHAARGPIALQLVGAVKTIDSVNPMPPTELELVATAELRAEFREECQRGVDAIRALRDSTAAIKADMLMVKMIFGDKAKSVVEGLGDLLAVGDIFDTIKTKGKYPDFEECRYLPFDEKIAKIDADIETLWQTTVKRDLDALD